MHRTAFAIDGGTVHIVSTDRAGGDFAVGEPAPDLDDRRAAIAAGPWTAPRQVHGIDIIDVGRPGDGAGIEADGSLTARPGCVLSVTTADCAPVVLVSTEGVAVVHAGWRGAEAGIVERAAAELGAFGAPVAAWIGPCIGPEAYEFGADDLRRLVERFGPVAAATTDRGTPALDLFAVVSASVVSSGFPAPSRPPSTADPRYFSHRVRGERERQVTAAWIEPS